MGFFYLLDDTCYSFWVGATLSILSKKQDWAASQISKSVQFVLSTQDPIIGGMGKWPDSHPDPVHTHMGLSGLSLSNSLELSPVYPALVSSKLSSSASIDILIRFFFLRTYLNVLSSTYGRYTKLPINKRPEVGSLVLLTYESCTKWFTFF